MPELEGHGAGDEALLAKLRRDPGGEERERVLQPLRVAEVTREGGLAAHGAGKPVRVERRAPVAMRPQLEELGFRADYLFQGRELHALDLRHLLQAQGAPAIRGLRADAGQRPEWEPREEALFPPGTHFHQSPRLGPVGRELGQHPVGADPHGAGQPGVLAHGIAQRLGNRKQGHRVEAVRAGEIEVALIQRGHDDSGGKARENLAHGAGRIAVVREHPLKERRLGTAANRLGDRHAGTYAVGPRGVGS